MRLLDMAGKRMPEQAAHPGQGADAEARGGTSISPDGGEHDVNALTHGMRKRARRGTEEETPLRSLAPVRLPAFNPERLAQLHQVPFSLLRSSHATFTGNSATTVPGMSRHVPCL